MKKIKDSTKIFAFLSLVVVAVVVWQAVAASRVVYDQQMLKMFKNAAADEDLITLLENGLKTYQKVPVPPFSKINVADGVVVRTITSESCCVYRSCYDRAQVIITQEDDVLYISFKEKGRMWNNINTPIFVLIPKVLED